MNRTMEDVMTQTKGILKFNTQVFSPEVEKSLRLFIKKTRAKSSATAIMSKKQ